MELQTNEAERLAALVSYGILDTEFEETYDRITRLAAQILDAPISLVSLVDDKRQWFKSAFGLDARETPREYAFCDHAIRKEGVYLVPNAYESDLFNNNPLVTGAPNVVFYAGAPLVNPDGFALGTLCVIDHHPRHGMSDADQSILTDFASLVVELMETRKELRNLRCGRIAV